MAQYLVPTMNGDIQIQQTQIGAGYTRVDAGSINKVEGKLAILHTVKLHIQFVEGNGLPDKEDICLIVLHHQDVPNLRTGVVLRWGW